MVPKKSEWKIKCKVCKQYTAEVSSYEEILDNFVDEEEVLANEQFSSYVNYVEIEDGNIPSLKLTSFAIYDKYKHLCPFDSGLLENGVDLLFAGYIKANDGEDPSINDEVLMQDIGPIKEWWVYGFDGGDKPIVGLNTENALYYLMEPSTLYENIFKNIYQKSTLSKIVIEYLLDFGFQNPPLEDLMQHVKNCDFPEELLFQEAQFICNQIISYDQDVTSDEPLISLSCIQTLVKQTGITLTESSDNLTPLKDIKKLNILRSGITSTKLVKNVFEDCFCGQLDNKSVSKRHTSDESDNQIQASGKKHGEKNNDHDNSSEKLESEYYHSNDLGNKPVKHKDCSKLIIHNVEWLKKSSVKYNGCQGYSSATINNFMIQQGSYVMLNAEEPNEPLRIARVSYMYDSPTDGPMFHAHFFCRGIDTILGNTANPRELFIVDDCDECPLGCIVQKTEVQFKQMPENWENLGNLVDLPLELEDNGKSYYFSKIYDYEFSRFKDYIEDIDDFENPCVSCKWQKKMKSDETPVYENNCVKWRNETFSIGTTVFLEPGQTKNICETPLQEETSCADDKLHTELYRKAFDKYRGSNVDTPEPFTIGLIEDMQKQKCDIKIKVRMFYRPEDTCQSYFLSHTSDIHYLLWTNHVIWTTFKYVAGKCYVTYSDNESLAKEWCQWGPFRFYYTKAYDYKNYNIYNVPINGKKICCDLLSDEDIRVTRSNSKLIQKDFTSNISPVWPEIKTPLKCMDIYAGCGGLSEGLHQSGVAKTLWAIEKETASAQAYQINNPDCKVFTEDCNTVLEVLLNSKAKNLPYPVKGDIELLIGGPPCQGYSGMNRFSGGHDSNLNNLQIVTFLSYCDYYRPKYFIFENVRNFVSFKKSQVFKLTLKCLLAIGYQVAFGILQAGNFGLPQTRRRFFLIGAAPGCTLPNMPDALHVFSRSGTFLSILVDGLRYDTGSSWTESLPYRTICVRDAISDLPDIENGATATEIPYDEEPRSYFQQCMRKNNHDNLVKDHICKEMSVIVEARMSHIPTHPGADWRDLPNKAVQLKNGMVTKVLKYLYRKKNQKRHEPPKGVCKCVLGKKCDPSDRQSNTMIPWFLVHTADKHNNWVSVYGRLDWDGFFGTTITNPEPTGTQGRVLHPEQNRVVSVRECARSQGFPDHYKFCGNILDKHRQIGNAVPPPLAFALGKEIIKACNKNTSI